MSNNARPTAGQNNRERSSTERFLGLFTEIRAGEGRSALLLSLNVFLLLTAYYFIKPMREGWIAISDFEGLTKMEVKAYSSFAQSLVLVLIVSWYGKLASRWDRITLITRVTLFCVAVMLVFWLLQPGFIVAGSPLIGVIFYIWVGFSGVFIIAQVWTFCTDIYSDEQGKRLLPLVAIGATLGGVVGSRLIGPLLTQQVIPDEYLMLVGLFPLLMTIPIAHLVDAAEGRHDGVKRAAVSGVDRASLSIFRSNKFVLSSPFLLSAAIVTLLSAWVNTNGENLLFRLLQWRLAEQAAEQGITDAEQLLLFTRSGTTAFYSNFFFWVNSIGLLLQAFLASRLVKYGGFATVALMLPLVALLSYSTMILLPLLMVIKIMKVAENAIDYSINNTARHIFWLPVSSEVKYLGKPAIDSLYVRLGDGFAALTVVIGTHILSVSRQDFLLFTIGLILCWLLATWLMIREHSKAVRNPGSVRPPASKPAGKSVNGRAR